MGTEFDTPAGLRSPHFDETVMGKAAELKQLLISQTLDDLRSWEKAVDDEWARAHPGEWAGSPIPPEEVEGYRNTVRTSYYEWVVPSFEQCLRPDPSASDPMIQVLNEIRGMFQGGTDGSGGFTTASAALGRINDVRTDMSCWEGDLRTNFIDNFLTPLQSVAPNQGVVAQAAAEIFGMNKILYVRYRERTLALLDKAIEAVKSLKNGKNPKSYVWGTLVGISIGTVLTLGTGGLAVAGVVTIVGSTLAQGLTPESKTTSELSAPTAQEVANNVYAALTSMQSTLYDSEREIKGAFDDCFDTISRSRTSSVGGNVSGPFAVAKPNVSTARPGEITDGSLRPRH